MDGDAAAASVKKTVATARSSFGLDFARSGDLSVILPLLEGQSLVRTCPFTIEMRNVPFKQQEQIVFALASGLPRFSFAAFDAGGNGQYLAEVAMQRFGSSSIAQIHLTAPWYQDNFPRLKAALEDGMLDALPQDRDVLDDLRAVQVIGGIPKIGDVHTKGADGGQRHGDTAVAAVLAWFASCQGGGAIEFMPVPLRTRDRDPTQRRFDADFARASALDDLGEIARRGSW